MAKRFFKATDNTYTVFRATERSYASASFSRNEGGVWGISFSSRPPTVRWGQGFPTTEITKAEYDALVALKAARMERQGDSGGYTSPSDSWVRNSELPAPLPTVQDVHVGYGKFSWTWNYRLGNRVVCGPGYANEEAARAGLAAHLAERGLAAPA